MWTLSLALAMTLSGLALYLPVLWGNKNGKDISAIEGKPMTGV
jgi:hypothetical protein